MPASSCIKTPSNSPFMGRKVPTDSPLWGELKIDEVNRRSATVPPAPDRKEEG